MLRHHLWPDYSFGNISTVPQETTMFFQTNYRNLIFCLGEVSLSAPFSCDNAISFLVTLLLPFCRYDLEVTLPRWFVSLFKCIDHPAPMDSELPSCQQGPIYPTSIVIYKFVFLSILAVRVIPQKYTLLLATTFSPQAEMVHEMSWPWNT